MQLPLADFQTLVTNFITAMQATNPSLTDVSENSVCLAFAEASAHNALTLENIAINLLAVTRMATSTDDDLDTFGAQFGFSRLTPTYASGQVEFSRNSPGTLGFIPVGSQVQSADGSQTYTVILDTGNPSWNPSLNGYALFAGVISIDVPVVADNPGIVGNAAIGAISVAGSALVGVDNVTNPIAFTNAVANESDDSYRSRFVNFINSRSLGTTTAIASAIDSLGMNLTYNILDGVNISGTLTPGIVSVYVDDGTSGAPIASSKVAQVNLTIQSVRSAGVQAFAYPAAKVNANINFSLAVLPGVDKNAVIAAINQALPALINKLPVGTALTFYSIPSMVYNAAPGQILSIENLTLNGATVDIGGAANQAVRLSSLTVG